MITNLFVTVWLIIAPNGEVVAELRANVPQSAAACMFDAEALNNIQYATGVAVMSRLPFKTVEGTCAVYVSPVPERDA